MRYSLYFAGALLVVAFVAGACGGDGGGRTVPTRSFEEVRGELVDRLDSIKANISAVPDDIQTQIIGLCQELDAFVGEDRVEEICGALEEAFDRDDPGRIDRVLAELAELED